VSAATYPAFTILLNVTTSRSVHIPGSFKLSNTTMPCTVIATVVTVPTLGTRNSPAASRRRRQESSATDTDEAGFFYVSPDAGEATDAYRSWAGK
jgi:hypothetical protein